MYFFDRSEKINVSASLQVPLLIMLGPFSLTMKLNPKYNKRDYACDEGRHQD